MNYLICKLAWFIDLLIIGFITFDLCSWHQLLAYKLLSIYRYEIISGTKKFKIADNYYQELEKECATMRAGIEPDSHLLFFFNFYTTYRFVCILQSIIKISTIKWIAQLEIFNQQFSKKIKKNLVLKVWESLSCSQAIFCVMF